MRNATHFLTWDGSLDLKKETLWACRGTFLTHHFLFPAKRKRISIRLHTVMNHINEELNTKYVPAAFPKVSVSACYILFYLSLFIDLFLPWVRWLVAGLLQRRLKFDPRPVHVEYVVGKVSLRQVLSPSTSGFPRHHYSSNASSSCSFTCHECFTRVGTLIVATIYLQLIQNRYIFRRFTLLQCSHQHCVQPVASDVDVVGYL